MTKKDNTPLYETYDYKCTKCDARHPKKQAKCFVCGGKDTLIRDKILKRSKPKSKIKGTTLTIKV